MLEPSGPAYCRACASDLRGQDIRAEERRSGGAEERRRKPQTSMSLRWPASSGCGQQRAFVAVPCLDSCQTINCVDLNELSKANSVKNDVDRSP